jgi:ubiquinone/menaquinone biosynthesis C-methylase UbiE
MRAPFPYSTYSTTTVGDQLIRQGLLLRQFRVKPGARVVEFGPGWGNLTLELAKMGFAMTAADVNLEFGDLITQRAGKLGLEIQVVTSDMLDYQPDEPFEAAVFFESFHHCSDHLQMLRNLTRIVRDDGVLAFGAEPIGPLPYPWGLRPDGMAVWSTRKFGWLENGFTEQYFFEALERTGWKGDFFFSQDIPCSVVIARRILAG